MTSPLCRTSRRLLGETLGRVLIVVVEERKRAATKRCRTIDSDGRSGDEGGGFGE